MWRHNMAAGCNVFVSLFFVWSSITRLAWTKSDASESRVSSAGQDLQVDPNGYIIYCPCMGRFGNQADYFLGSLGFAKKLNRTLILPPWRTYKNVQFDEWFQVETVQQYHRALLAETFMRELAPTVWPEGERTGMCWTSGTQQTEQVDCAMKKGDPFGPFWTGLGVDIDSYIQYRIGYSDASAWHKEFPADKYPVIALKGAPASFPVVEEYVGLQRYLQWSENLERQADSYIQANFPGEIFVGIHLRNGIDWKNGCEHVKGSKSFMSSPQCLGYRSEQEVTQEICYPSPDTILRLTKQIVDSIKATAVYVATDKDPMLSQLRSTLGDKVKVFHQDPWLPQIDLVILGKSHHFIGNCVSSFSAFTARERLMKNKLTSYWGYS